jgi:CRISPR-associated protein Cmr1
MRSAPKISPPKIEPKKSENLDLITQVREYKLITPLYGGGVEPSKADPVTLIRGTSIRGHLRFWWRACRAGEFHTIEEMKTQEDKIWGATKAETKKQEDEPGKVANKDKSNNSSKIQKVQLVVSNSKGIKNYPVLNNRNLGYATFPLRTQGDSTLFAEIEFSLKITFHKDFSKDVEAALWAWEAFGGIGARTRRGFGAIYRKSVNPIANSLSPEKLLKADLKKHVVDSPNWPKDVPHLSLNPDLLKITREFSTTQEAWENLIDKLKEFRQQRSKWPEPDEIRRLTNQHKYEHKPEHGVHAFPRAAFGLPIIFQFKDSKAGDPRETTLALMESDRLASPLILRPFLCSNGKTVGLAIILQGTQRLLKEKKTILSQNKKKVKDGLAVKLSQQEASQILKTGNKAKLLGEETDVLKAFLNFLNS